MNWNLVQAENNIKFYKYIGPIPERFNLNSHIILVVDSTEPNNIRFELKIFGIAYNTILTSESGDFFPWAQLFPTNSKTVEDRILTIADLFLKKLFF